MWRLIFFFSVLKVVLGGGNSFIEWTDPSDVLISSDPNEDLVGENLLNDKQKEVSKRPKLGNKAHIVHSPSSFENEEDSVPQHQIKTPSSSLIISETISEPSKVFAKHPVKAAIHTHKETKTRSDEDKFEEPSKSAKNKTTLKKHSANESDELSTKKPKALENLKENSEKWKNHKNNTSKAHKLNRSASKSSFNLKPSKINHEEKEAEVEEIEEHGKENASTSSPRVILRRLVKKTTPES
jgi:hypothetical protein